MSNERKNEQDRQPGRHAQPGKQGQQDQHEKSAQGHEKSGRGSQEKEGKGKVTTSSPTRKPDSQRL
jgi:hypothetical protein